MIWGLQTSDNILRTMERADGDMLKVQTVDQSIDLGYKPPRNIQWLTGRRLDETFVPRRMQLGFGRREAVEPDYLQLHLVPVVSHLMREVIEEAEPGVHQFVQIDALSRAGERYEKTYSWFNCCQRVFALDVEKTQPPMKPFPKKPTTPVNPYGHHEAMAFDIVASPESWKPVFHADKIGTRQLFVDGGFDRYLLLADDLKKKLEAANLTGFRFVGPYELSE